MDIVSDYNHAINAIVQLVHAPRSLLHVHAGMVIYLACQLMLGTRRGSLVAVAVVLQIELAHEVMNRLFHGSWRWPDTIHDIALTLFWPVLCYGVSRFRRWQWTQRERAVAERQAAATKAPGDVAYS